MLIRNLTSLCCTGSTAPIETNVKAIPPHTGIEHGVLAIRSPDRPNPIGICIVKLIRQEGNLLFVRGLDAIDGTALLDIKPYSADLDSVKQ